MRLPDAFSFEQAMAIGTAGYTAALCVNALERWGAIKPGEGEVLVTGGSRRRRVRRDQPSVSQGLHCDRLHRTARDA